MGGAKVRPSEAHRWLPCPGSVVMQERYPETGRSPAAEDGQAAHWAATQGGDVTGRTAPNGVIVSAEMWRHVEVYWNALPVGATLETPVTVPRVHPLCSGTPDAWFFDTATQTLYVWDFKYGYGIVEPYENPQLACYASGIMDYLGIKTDGDITLCLAIVQPRPWHELGPVRSWRLKAVGLRGLVNRLHSAAHEALGPDPQVSSGEHCAYCSARHACPAGRRAALNAVDVSHVAVGEELDPVAIAVELDILEAGKRAIEERLAGLEVQALNILQKGGAVPGRALGYGRGARKWNRPDEEVLALGSMFGVNLATPLTPHQAELAGVDKKLVGAYTETTKGSIKLVRADQTAAAKILGGQKYVSG